MDLSQHCRRARGGNRSSALTARRVLHLPAVLLLTAGLLGTRAGRSHASAAEAQYTDPSPHRVRRIVVASGVSLEILDWGGRGAPLVFLAGYGNSAHVFDDFAPQFRNAYRVVGITRRGFGASSLPLSGYDNATLVKDVVAVLDSLGLTRPFLVAHSFGGAELNGIAVTHPRAARGFIYLDGAFDFAELYADSAWVHTPIPRPPLPKNYVDSPKNDAAYMSAMTGPGYPEAEVRSNSSWSAVAARAPGFHAESLATRLMRGTPPMSFRRISVPALAIVGVPATVQEKYPWYARASADAKRKLQQRFAVETPLLARQRSRFRAEVSEGKVIEISGGRHYVFLTHPAQVARAIRAFAR